MEWHRTPDFRKALGLDPVARLGGYSGWPAKWLCPDASLARPTGVFHYSYGQNYVGYPWKTNPRWIATRRGEVKSPSERFLFSDSLDGYVYKTNSNPATGYDLYGETRSGGVNIASVAYRHQDGANLVFHDGHGESMHKELVYDASISTSQDRLWHVSPQ